MTTNPQSDFCLKCGARVPARAGSLSRCRGRSGSCWIHWDQDGGGEHAMCADKDACAALLRPAHLCRLHARFKGTGPGPVTDGALYVLEGDVVYLRNRHGIKYGDGEWCVIEPATVAERRVWYVVNNGAPGADGSRNNVAMGQAGAIGRALPWSQELEAQVRACEEVPA